MNVMLKFWYVNPVVAPQPTVSEVDEWVMLQNMVRRCDIARELTVALQDDNRLRFELHFNATTDYYVVDASPAVWLAVLFVSNWQCLSRRGQCDTTLAAMAARTLGIEWQPPQYTGYQAQNQALGQLLGIPGLKPQQVESLLVALVRMGTATPGPQELTQLLSLAA